MSESIPSQLRRADPEVLVVPAAEISPVANEPTVAGIELKPETQPASPMVVEARQVHGRGGIIPEKGDVFVNPQSATREQLVIEGVRRDGDDTIVLFTPEIQPGVRKEPGKKIRQLPLRNFHIKASEYSELQPIYKERLNQTAEEFGDIWNASQDLLVKVLAQDEDSENPDVIAERERAIELLQEIGQLEDEWDALGDDESRAKLRGAAILLKRSKELVGELPESLVVSNVLLRKIQKEYGAKVDSLEEEGGFQKKKKASKQRGSVNSAEGPKKTKGRHDSRRESNPLMEGTVEKGHSEMEGAHTESESDRQESELRYWTDDIRAQQQEREELSARIIDRNLTTEWGEAMKAIDPALEKFARKPFRDINGHLEDVWQQYAEWRNQLQREKASMDRLKHLEMFDQWLEKTLDTLMQYAKRYQAMLEAGKKVLKEHRDQAPKSSQNKQERSGRSRRLRGREMQNIGDKEWSQLHPEVRAVIDDEMVSMKERCLGYYDSAVAKLTAGGIADPKEQHQIIVERISPVLAESISPVLAAAGVKIPEESIKAIADKQAEQLLGGKFVAITYGGE